jgi:hypothetical protein
MVAARERHAESLEVFVKDFWAEVEPGAELAWGWALSAMCQHLEAVTDGRIKRLLINVPFGMMKSLLINVFWPAWEWGPSGLPSQRYLCAAFKEEHSLRDARRMRQLVSSPRYQSLYGSRVNLVRTGEGDFENG